MKNKKGKLELSIFGLGVALIFIGITMPSFINVKMMGIYPDLNRAVEQNEKLYLIIAALKLVWLNSIRAFPHYLGVFSIAESMDTFFMKKNTKIVKPILVFTLILLVYWLIESLYGIKYDFGIPAVLIIAMIIVLEKIGFNVINFYKKAMMVIMLIGAIQCLDIIPSLSGFAFGRGEASNDIKIISGFLGADNFLQMTAVLFFFLLFTNSLLLFKLIIDEKHLKLLGEEKEHNEKMLNETRIRVLENRTYMELQHLVHDLKSPLTSALALVGVIKLGNMEKKQLNYLSKIEFSIESISRMISEILYEDCKTMLHTREIITTLLSGISNTEYGSLIEIENNAPDAAIYVNKIRFVRALINILENSFYAVDRDKGKISVKIERERDPFVSKVNFSVTDNGRGIFPAILDMIWSSGFSSRNSLGLGLKFVKEVIENHEGSIEVDSSVGVGTTVTIKIPEGEFDE